MSLPEHQRIIPAFDISEEGLRQLEIWLLDILGRGGSGWRFKVLNGITTAKTSEKGWGYLLFTECFDLDLVPDPLSAGGDWGAVFVDDSGCGFLIGSTFMLQLRTREAPINLLADVGDISIFANQGDVEIKSVAGDIFVRIGTAAKTVTFTDSGGNPIFRVDENGDLHGKTGKALTFDL